MERPCETPLQIIQKPEPWFFATRCGDIVSVKPCVNLFNAQNIPQNNN